jgi:hypothetical protein
MSLRLLALSLLVLAGPLAAQQGGTRPRVFMDCNSPNCDRNYFRTEINWVNWVNDREVADLHVIVGSVSTSGGGREYQLDFLDTHPVADEGYEEQLGYSQLGTDTNRETLDGLTHTLGLGIAAWANTHGFRGLVTLRGPDPELGGAGQRRLVSQEEVDDPWNLWIFSLNGNVNKNSEETSTTSQYNGGFSASRVTPTWKMNFNHFANHRRLRRTLTSGTFRDIRTNWTASQLIAYSVAEHWSIGIASSVGRSPTENQELNVRATPAIEYSFFPYDEATRHSLTAFYRIGPTYSDYIEPTIYLETTELRYQQSLEIDFSSRQTWGDAGFTIGFSHYLHDIDLNNRSIQGDVSYRIARGIEVNARGDLAWVNDQIFLPVDDATDEETLLNLQRRATDRTSSFSVGLRIQFGSIFNNVVNNRFRRIGGFGGGFGGGGGGGGPRGGF